MTKAFNLSLQFKRDEKRPATEILRNRCGHLTHVINSDKNQSMVALYVRLRSVVLVLNVSGTTVHFIGVDWSKI